MILKSVELESMLNLKPKYRGLPSSIVTNHWVLFCKETKIELLKASYAPFRISIKKKTE